MSDEQHTPDTDMIEAIYVASRADGSSSGLPFGKTGEATARAEFRRWLDGQRLNVTREQVAQAAPQFKEAYWDAYTAAVRAAPSNRPGQGISEADGLAAGQAGREAGLIVALALMGIEVQP